jgi:2-polyprenyl-3-methyl-5-hydroxy-6-metoxy-1,4-benzoquinol methylase
MDDYKRLTISAYDAQPEAFSEKFKTLLELHERFEFQTFITLLPGKRILDMGCGSGDYALYFQTRGLHVTAIDLSEGMVTLAKKKGVDAQLMDIEEMHFAAEEFDGIWSVTSLLHVPKAHASNVVKKMHEILRPHGIVYLCVMKGDGEKIVNKYGVERFFSFWQPQELKELFCQFEFIEQRETSLGDRLFLQMFFRK